MPMQRVSPDQFHCLSPLHSAAVFEADPRRAGRLQLEDFEDDLDRYQAAHFVFQGVPLVVQRHVGNPPDTYTIDVDFESARQRQVALSSVTRRIVHDLLELPDDAVIWSVGEPV